MSPAAAHRQRNTYSLPGPKRGAAGRTGEHGARGLEFTRAPQATYGSAAEGEAQQAISNRSAVLEAKPAANAGAKARVTKGVDGSDNVRSISSTSGPIAIDLLLRCLPYQ